MSDLDMDRQGSASNQEDSGAVSQFVCTANHGFAPYAQEELRRTFGAVKSQVLESGEVFLASLAAENSAVVEDLLKTQPVFLRHLFPAEMKTEVSGNVDLEGLAKQLAEWASSSPKLTGRTSRGVAEDEEAAITVAVQVRKSSGSKLPATALQLKEAVEAAWPAGFIQFAVRDADYIFSVYAAEEAVYAGVSLPEENLSDWNGGAIRFLREEGQISRAKFKLLEAERIFGIEFGSFRRALDIGAAPGGWTSFLLERGLQVTAVDPAKMHPALLENPQLTYLRKNADSVKFEMNEFDLLVCDMSWNPKLTARLVIDLLYSLAVGGTAVVTIKLLSKKPLALIKEITEMYTDARMQIVQAKQLFHNRDEITLYMIKY